MALRVGFRMVVPNRNSRGPQCGQTGEPLVWPPHAVTVLLLHSLTRGARLGRGSTAPETLRPAEGRDIRRVPIGRARRREGRRQRVARERSPPC